MIICPNTGDECSERVFPEPRTGFLIISSKENSVETRKKLDAAFNSIGFVLKDAMNIKKTKSIYCKICQQILASAFGVTLITKHTPQNALRNLFLETGLMLAFGKEVIILTDSITNIPSDLRGKEIFVVKDDKDLFDSIVKWNKTILETSSYWEEVADLSLDGKDYEKAFEYLKRTIMLGDMHNSLYLLKKILRKQDQGEINLPERLKLDIENFVRSVETSRQKHRP